MRMTLDSEYCLKADTRVLGVAGEVNGRKITFSGWEVTGATTYKIKFGLPDKTSFEDTISDAEYTIPSNVVAQPGKVQVQVSAVNGTSMVRKSQIFVMQVVDSIDYEPSERSGSATGAATFDLTGTTRSTQGVAVLLDGDNIINRIIETEPEQPEENEEDERR